MVLLWTLSIILSVFTVYDVFTRRVNLVSLASWIGSIIAAWHALPEIPQKKKELPPMNRFIWETRDIRILFFIGMAELGILWYFSSIPAHYHQDEFITAYTSWSLPPITKLDWFAAYPPVWVSQFPVLFHILQQPFFLASPNVEAIRISVWPYAILITVSLYFLARTLFSRRIAVIAILMYIIFAPNVYLSSMGLHFMSATAFYMALIGQLAFFFQTKNARHAKWAGLWCGLCYLTYTSSYVAYPVLALIVLLAFIMIRERYIIHGFLVATIISLLVLAPFITYAKVANNFFVQRIDQVNIFWGSWHDGTSASPLLERVTTHVVDAIKALVEPNVGGLGGYNFGKQGLLDPFTATLLVVGLVVLVLGVIKRNYKYVFLLIALFVPFLSGYVLTTHPPPFHRLSIIYPLLTLLIALGTDRVASLVKGRFVLFTMIIIVAITNIHHAWAMIQGDKSIYPQNSRVIGEYINTTVPQGETIHIAAYPSFYLGQELLFRTNNRYTLVTDESRTILKTYTGNNMLVLLNPSEETTRTLRQTYPDHVLITHLGDVSLGDLAIFQPK